jgi:hypothetical protein
MNPLQALSAFDGRCAAYGLHALSPFWTDTLARFYSHPTAKRLVARVGRGGAKSFTAVRVAVFETVMRQWQVPEGERHYFAIVSALKSEAAERRQMIRTILDALGIPYESAGDVISLSDRPLGFRVFASEGRAVRGFRCIGYVADELAFWPHESDGADPAGDVLSSLDAMCITHPEARSLYISSPWGIDDAHATAFDRGNTDDQIVAQAATWDANPAVTRADCLKNAKGDPRAFRRDYEAIPGPGSGAALDPEELARAFERAPAPHVGETWIAIDASNLNHDSFAWVVMTADSEGALCVLYADAVNASDHRTIDYVLERIQETAQTYGARRVVADQYASAYLPRMFADLGMFYERLNWTVDSKTRAVDALRTLLAKGAVSLVAHPRLKSEAFSLQGKLSQGGKETFATNGRDFIACVLTGCMAIADGVFPLEALADDTYADFGRGRGGSGAAPAVPAAMAQFALTSAMLPQAEHRTHWENVELARALAESGLDPESFAYDRTVATMRYALENGDSNYHSPTRGDR